MLRIISDSIIYSAIDKVNRKNVHFVGAYRGIQCQPEITDYDALFEDPDKFEYKSFECTCYNYKVITEQGVELHIGFQNGYYLYTRVCFDKNDSIVEEPEIENLILTSAASKTTHIDLSQVKLITESQTDEKCMFGKSPVLVYQTNQERLLWKAIRHHGKMNVTVYEFDIDAETGEILRMRKSPYRRTFWQWIGGAEI